MQSTMHRAFTLVEILIVVIILGVLAAVVVPQVSSASQESAATATTSELQKIRMHIEYYRSANSGALPNVVVGDGTWGQIIGPDNLRSAPVNAWVGSPNGKVIAFGAAPDNAFQSAHGWIFNPANGEVFAGSFDANDQPIFP
jgi:general secretion pathway protein G